MTTLTQSRPLVPSLWRGFSMLLALALTGCAGVNLISGYDEATDKGITEFQKSAETFLIGLERTGRPAGNLTKPEAAFFQKAAVDLSALQVRAAAIPKNEITVSLIEGLARSMATLEELLQEGITKEQIKPVRDALNSSTVAILKLELAKKRGEPAN